MPVRRYSQIKKREMRAVQIFNLLVAAAHRRETITYKILAAKLGYKGAGVFAQQLGPIMNWCAANGLPPLTVLVVGSESGTPGTGLTTPINRDAEREEVYAVNWLDIVPPQPEELS